MRLLFLSLFFICGSLSAQDPYCDGSPPEEVPFQINWTSCNSFQICLDDYEQNLYENPQDVWWNRLRARIEFVSTPLLNPNDEVTFENVPSGGCRTITGLRLEWSFELRVSFPERVFPSTFCQPVTNAFGGGTIGCLGELNLYTKPVQVGSSTPTLSSCIINPSDGDFCSFWSTPTICESDLLAQDRLTMKLATFGDETDFRIDIFGPSNNNYQTTGWRGRPVDDHDGSFELCDLLAIWRQNDPNWRFWPNSEPYRVAFVVRKDNCTAWKAREIQFRVVGTCLNSGKDPKDKSFAGAGDTAPMVYPNPFDDQLVITGIPLANGASVNSYQLTNTAGQIIASGQVASSNQRLNTAHLPSGLYFLRVEGPEGQVLFTQKVIKN